LTWMNDADARIDVYDGYDVPTYSHKGMERLYAGTPFSSFGPFYLNSSGTYAKGPEGARIYAWGLRDMADEEDADFIELFARIKYIPNGQLKNFLVACRTFYQCGEVCHIAVVGSKSQEGSGSWHKYLAFFLSYGRQRVTIDFLDPNEVSSEWQTKINGCEVHLRWIPDAVSPSDVTGYDAVSSDVWNYGTKTEWGVPDVPIFSLKGGELDYEPYLHPYETRKFSSPHSTFKARCPCLTCKSCAQSSRSWKDFVILRTLAARLGNPFRCRGAQWVYDNNTIHDIRQEIVSGGQVDNIPENFRYIMALSLEEAVQSVGTHFVKGSVIKRLDPRTIESTIVRQKMTGLEGKSVAFAGVDPSILGNIKCLVNPKPVFGKSHDVLFTSNVVSWGTNYLADQVFCPERPDIVEKAMFGWRWTGVMLNEFYEYRQTGIKDPPKRVKFLQKGHVRSLVVSRKCCSLVPFNGTNLIFADGNLFTTYDASTHYDPRCTFSRKFWYVDTYPESFQVNQPLFLPASTKGVLEFDFFYSPQFTYQKKYNVIIVSISGRKVYRGSCPADYYRDYGVRLSRNGQYVPILIPFQHEEVFYLT